MRIITFLDPDIRDQSLYYILIMCYTNSAV